MVADDLDRAAVAAQANDDFVERADARDVPEMRGRHVDEDGGRGFIDLKAPREAVDRGEEDLAGHEIGRPHSVGRSEEHTSELQSLMRCSYAVFCLKKKKNTTQQ